MTKIGWARRDISTTEPVSINGQMYIRISEGIHDPIMVTALAVDSGEDSVIFCSCDVTGLRQEAYDLALEKIRKANPDLPADKVLLNATHTHSSSAIFETPERSPDGRYIYPGLQYREFFADMVCQAVCEAWENRRPGGIAYGYGYAVVGHSRRVLYLQDQGIVNPNSFAPNGHGVMYGSTKKEDFAGYEAGSDAFLNLLFTVDAENKLTGVVVNVPCPSQVSEQFTRLSADYWNEVRVNVAREFGPEVYVLPQCAAAGDLSPRIMHYKKAQARRMGLKYGLPYEVGQCKRGSQDLYNKCMGERLDIGERIMDGIRDVWSWAQKDILWDFPVRHSTETVRLTRRAITEADRQWCEENLEKMRSQIPDRETATDDEYSYAMSRYNSARSRNVRAIAKYEDTQVHPTLGYNIHIIQVGPVAFASNPFELYMDFMHRIQGRSPFIQTFIVQLAGGSGQYLPTQRGVEDKGYSASIFCNNVGPEGGQELVEYTLDKLGQMARDGR